MSWFKEQKHLNGDAIEYSDSLEGIQIRLLRRIADLLVDVLDELHEIRKSNSR